MEKIINMNGLRKKVLAKLLTYTLIGTTAFSATACSKNKENTVPSETVTDVNSDLLEELDIIKPTASIDFSKDIMSNFKTNTSAEVTKEVSTELSLEKFNKLVDSIIEENKESKFYLDRNYVEVLCWALNKDITTPEVTNSILSNYATEEEFINTLMVAIMEYGNDSNKYANGEKDSYANLNSLFVAETSLSKAMPSILDNYYSTVETVKNPVLSDDVKNSKVSNYIEYMVNFGLYREYINETSFNEIFGSEKLALVLTYTTQFTWLKTRNNAVNNYANEIDLLEKTYMSEMLSQIYSELDIEYKKCEEYQNSKELIK